MTDPGPPPPPHRISALLPGWRTAQPGLRVLVVVHSVTAATRIADVLPALTDPRLQLFCVQTREAMFSAGVADFIRESGLHSISWGEAKSLNFDIAITASLGDNLHEIDIPILRIPHGNGYNKYGNREPGTGNREPGTGNREPGTGNREPAFGLGPETLKRDGRIVPAAIALSHHEQRDRLEVGCPEAVPLAFIAGDPCYDRLLASAARRLHYRRAFGLHPGQKLLVVNSTWREESLYGAHPYLIPKILAELPQDEFRTALVLHPNIWSAHSDKQIRNWLDEALRAGLLLMPPNEGWRAAVVAADHVISDHGSVSVYAAAIGRPVLLTADGRESVAPGSGLGRLMEVAEKLKPESAVRPQLDRAEQLRDHTTAVAARWVSSEPGRALALIRAKVYEMLGVAPPEGEPRLLAVPEPDLPSGPAASLWVHVRPAAEDPQCLEALRFPAAIADSARGETSRGPGVLVVSDAELDHRLAGIADIIRIPRTRLPADEEAWSDEVFRHRGGAGLTLIYDEQSAVLRTRAGHRTVIALDSVTHPADAELVHTVLAERALTGALQDPGRVAARLSALNPLLINAGPTRSVHARFRVT